MSMAQLGLHVMCCNKCDFCLIKATGVSDLEDILVEIEKAKENIKYISTCKDNWKNKFSDGISLLGGEIYFVKDQRYKDAILSLIDTIIEYVFKDNPNPNYKFSTVTNGMYDPEWLLFPVIDKIVEAVGINHVDVNFSYDLKYRFHTEESRKRCVDTINAFHKRYNYICGIQMILTQHVIDKYLSGWRTTDLIEEEFPGNVITLLYPHKVSRGLDYTNHKELEDFYFTRKSFLQFIKVLAKEEPKVFEAFYHSVRNSSIFKYTMMYDKLEAGTSTQVPILSDGKELINKECMHSELYRCYSDTKDNCLLCDLEELI